ncbi:hypothetical protein [Streptomyces cavernicola]|uniref:Uncharacterized protein n=1 Tax=Streptomyces cavernicola TaxID=3043613 RepID=A0ABT6SGR7_9ACTN|nr:hypothetical protein [Streptomyces sp. B-S-A6]MDI3407402.1 hypothetical protein [Streptomyces sp. B-S-A6]
MTSPDGGTGSDSGYGSTGSGGRVDDEPGVTVRCQDNASTGVRFCDRFTLDADSVHFAVDHRGWDGERSRQTYARRRHRVASVE